MSNPFSNRVSALSGPARDISPVVPNDGADLGFTAVGLYVETGGTLTLVTATGDTRSFSVPNFSIVPVGVAQVLETGTSAAGIHAYRI
ncbi:hypothetical protein DL239_19145 [Sedimentitalea sp. CY04]|uniref:Uncharacterized protein n=1 Tax=Parasedimentitalea denitrificans TaxID=2211118 RepID=A0ABX0WEI0_9RHOB|nr:hypothetical protein [Sedimentitalea sp. CY04]NIZ63087.1 hypothetical protein [Sedimentitalea sp. CY04]